MPPTTTPERQLQEQEAQAKRFGITVPEITADELSSPKPRIDLRGTFEAPTQRDNSKVINNVSNEITALQTAQQEAQKQAQEREDTFAALGMQSGANVRSQALESFGVTESTRELKDISLQLADANTASDLTKVRIASAAGQTAGQAGRELTQEDRENAVRNSGLAARAAVLQGNIETARGLVNDMMSDFNADRTTRLNIAEKQLNRAYDVEDEKGRQLIDQKKQEIADEKEAMKRVTDAVDAAITSGAASQQDIAQMTDASLSDEERLAIAQGIVGRGAEEARGLSMEEKRASIRASDASTASAWASARQKEVATALELAESGDRSAIEALGYNPAEVNGGIEGARQYEVQKADIQMGLNAADALVKNMTGLDLATGAYQTPLGTAAAQAITGGAAAGALVGGVPTAGVGAIPGAVIGAVAGIAATPFFYSRTKTAKDEFLASASFLINDVTFQEIRDLKASGVTFGNMTEGERIAAGRAASELASAAIIDVSGAVTGFRGAPGSIQGYVTDLQKAYQGRQEYLDAQYAITPDEVSEAEAIFNAN